MAKNDAGSGRKIISRNRKAYHEYYIEDTFEAGVVLSGSEIKSVRGNKVSLQDGFVQERGGELWLMNTHIAPYEQGATFGHTDPLRPRKLLLHKREIAKIITRIREKGYTSVPTQIYLVRGLAKVEIALAKGKHLYDKRQTMAKRDAERDIRRALKDY
jgi:SsrA-binding protein